NGDDVGGLGADAVEAGHQRLQIGAVEHRDAAARLRRFDISARLDGGDALRERLRLDDARLLGHAHRHGAVADGDTRYLDVLADDDGAGALVDHYARRRFRLDG